MTAQQSVEPRENEVSKSKPHPLPERRWGNERRDIRIYLGGGGTWPRESVTVGHTKSPNTVSKQTCSTNRYAPHLNYPSPNPPLWFRQIWSWAQAHLWPARLPQQIMGSPRLTGIELEEGEKWNLATLALAW